MNARFSSVVSLLFYTPARIVGTRGRRGTIDPRPHLDRRYLIAVSRRILREISPSSSSSSSSSSSFSSLLLLLLPLDVSSRRLRPEKRLFWLTFLLLFFFSGSKVDSEGSFEPFDVSFFFLFFLDFLLDPRLLRKQKKKTNDSPATAPEVLSRNESTQTR